jgi:hypothetical protein
MILFRIRFLYRIGDFRPVILFPVPYSLVPAFKKSRSSEEIAPMDSDGKLNR